MDLASVRRDRLKQLLELAQAYRGWTRKELANALGRDPTKLVPGQGVPKLDLVVALAEALDWSVGTVVENLWTDGASRVPSKSRDGYHELMIACRQAHRQGDSQLQIEYAQEAYRHAEAADQRAYACIGESTGWDSLGQYAKVLRTVQRGLAEPTLSADLRRILQSNLANAYYTLWSLVEARSLSGDLINHYLQSNPDSHRDRATQAYSYYVRGNTLRRMLASDLTAPEKRSIAHNAQQDLTSALELYEGLAADFDDDNSYLGIANTCRGGLIEVNVELGEADPESALEHIALQLDEVIDTTANPVGDLLESYGWLCIFGCNIALRHVTDDRELQRHMAVFTNKADEIAGELDNWSMRERVFTMEYARRQRLVEWTGQPSDWTIDPDDLRVIVGTMGRFPMFQDTGKRIIESARILRSS